MGKQGRVKAFSTLADRHQAVVAGEEQRAEQKASDEFGARSHASKNEAANAVLPTPTALPKATQIG
jgi:flagellar biosynthesis chaperone FliJ